MEGQNPSLSFTNLPRDNPGRFEILNFRRLAIIFGFIAIITSLLGLIGMRLDITLISSVYPGYKTIALSAAIIWIIIGSILVVNTVRPLKGFAKIMAEVVLAVIVVIELFELPLNILGGHSSVEIWLTGIGTAILGPSSSPISPAAIVLIIPAAVSLFCILQYPDLSFKHFQIRDVVCIAGLAIGVVSFTIIISYVFGNPLLYGTQFIPIAAISALAAFFIGSGLVAATGTGAIPLRYFTGKSTRSRLLRIFVPLTVVIILGQQIIFFTLSTWNPGHEAILIAASLVLFALVTGYIVSQVSRVLGGALDRAEEALVQQNEELTASGEELQYVNEELTATQEELRQKVEELSQRESDLSEALAEKEILLSEIHHRVKNNLTALISLLSLEGTYEDTPDGRNLRKDLQNRARSMALIHETLYRTKKYSRIDMDVYLRTLVEQITSSYMLKKPVRTVIVAEGITIDIARATPCGLIINEIVTNSLKHAFPESFDCGNERKEPCTIRISLLKENDTYVLTVGDNGIGLPEGIDIATTRSLGLKLVHFLAKHQLKAKLNIDRCSGTIYTFRFS